MIELIQNYWVYFLIGQYPDGPLGGLALTVILAALGLVLAFPLGLLLGLARVSTLAVLRRSVGVAVTLIRGTPLLMAVFWVYFFLPEFTGQKTGQFTTMLAVLVLFNGAYIAEIVRAGVLGLPEGQLESAKALGLGYWHRMRFVVLPQVLRHMLPSLVNQFIATIKDTSLGYIIGLTESSFIASQINNQVLTRPAQVYGALGLTYFILCFGLSRLAFWLERRLSAPAAKSAFA